MGLFEKIVEAVGGTVAAPVQAAAAAAGAIGGAVAQAAAPVGQVVDQTIQGATNVVDGVLQTVVGGTANALPGAAAAVGDVGKKVDDAANAAVQDATQFVKQLGNDINAAGSDLNNNLNAATSNLGNAGNQGLDDLRRNTAAEIERAGGNVSDFVVAVGSFLWNQLEAQGDLAKSSVRKIQEGKLIDAIWECTIKPYQSFDKNAYAAIRKSTILSTLTSAAAASYGPGGSAAYAAWYTYKTTGNLELAIKTGAIAGIAAGGLKAVDQMPLDSADALTKRTLGTAAIGGAAVAAAGGSEKDVLEAFMKGAAYTAARNAYKQMTDAEIKGKAPTRGPKAKPINVSLKPDANGKIPLDQQARAISEIRDMGRDYSHAGTAFKNFGVNNAGSEDSIYMKLASQIPYMNDMAYFHDQWCVVASYGDVEIKATILPAIILTHAGQEGAVTDPALAAANR